MSTGLIVFIIIMVILVAAVVVLYFLGKKAQKKQAEQEEAIQAAKQSVSMLIIDKKRMKLKESGLPSIVMEQTPKYMRGAKVPIVKAKVGPKVLNLMCDEKIFDDIPVKKEVKALINGIYIIEVKGLRGSLAKPAEETKKKGLFSRFRKK